MVTEQYFIMLYKLTFVYIDEIDTIKRPFMTKVLISQVFCLLVGLFSDIRVECTYTLTYIMFLVHGVNFVVSIFFSRLLGIITKKDVLRHIATLANQDPDSILFHWQSQLKKKTIYVLHDVISHTIIWSHNILNQQNCEWSVEKWTLGPCVATLSLGS